MGGFDGCVVPEALRPYVDWVTGMAWPEGDEQGCFRMADACVMAAHRVTADTAAADPATARMTGKDWDGAAQQAFAEHVRRTVGGRQAELVKRLIDAAIALNGVGVAIQHAKRMITLIVIFLLLTLPLLIWQAPWALTTLLQVTRMSALQIARATLALTAFFAAFGGALDLGTQLSQIKGGRRDEIDGHQLLISLRDGAINGLLTGLLGAGLGRLATPALRAGVARAEATFGERLLAHTMRTAPGQALQYGVAGSATTAISLTLDGRPLDWDLILKGGTSALLGADGQNLATPRLTGHHTGPGTVPPPHIPPILIPDSPDPPSGSGRDTTVGPAADATSEAARHTALSGGADRSPHPGQGQLPTATRPLAVPDGDLPGHGTGRAEHGSTAEAPPGTREQGRAPAAEGPRGPVPHATEPAGSTASRRAPDDAAPPATRSGSPAGETPIRQAEQRPGTHGARPDDQAAVPSHPATPGARAPVGDPQPPASALTRADPVPADGSPRPGVSQAPASPVPHTPVPHNPVPHIPVPHTPVPGADPVGGTPNVTRVPFAFEGFYADPRWAADAGRFEQRLGAYYFNDRPTADAARTALGRLRDVLMALTPRRAEESPAAFARRVENAFFRDDAVDSAGQVGTRVSVDELIAHGNVRELVTAFYNAAYFNRDHAQTLARIVLHVIDHLRWDQARAAGLDLGEIRRAQLRMDGSINRALLGRLDSRIMGESRLARDPLATGNVALLSERGLRDLTEVIRSQMHRQDRTAVEQQRLGLITTPAFYEGHNVPLGRFERAFVESVIDGPLRPDTPLPWREGGTAHENASSRWARRVSDDGLPVIDGISMTTAKLLTAVKFLGLDRATTERFLGALMGWMLPGREHSLFEIIRGAQLTGLGGPQARPDARVTAVDLHRNLPGMDLRTLRAEVLPDGLFPHEARYMHHATDPDGFAETRHREVGEIADRLGTQFGSGRVTDPVLADWLRRNGIDPLDAAKVRELGERLSPAHMTALTVYTRPSHDLINNVTRTRLWTAGVSDAAIRKVMNLKVEKRVADYLRNIAEGGGKARSLAFPLRPLLHAGEGFLTPKSPLSPAARQWVDAARLMAEAKNRHEEHRAAGRTAEAREARAHLREAHRAQRAAWREIRDQLGAVTPRLSEELRWHADMAHDALMQLPPVGTPDHPVIAYRGDWLTPVHSPIYGSPLYPHGTTREFLSLSRNLEVAGEYVLKNLVGDRGVLVVYRLTGGQGRDISVFSTNPTHQEVLLPPHSHARRLRDPELEARVRDSLEKAAEDMVRRGVLDRAPRGYEIVIMEEE
ncbi:WXG100-like domain-containing protein [Streptosporangium soli]|nr:hypothetical protein [Streptosporangium sp. KLBMP 9127]